MSNPLAANVLRSHVELQKLGHELAEACETLLDCFERRNERWKVIDGLNIGVALQMANHALQDWKRATDAESVDPLVADGYCQKEWEPR